MKLKLGKSVDRIIMGAIIGGAVASVVGRIADKKRHNAAQQSLPLEEHTTPRGEKVQRKRGIFRRLMGL